MKKSELRQRSTDITRSIIRGADDVTEARPLELLPDIVMSVRLDRSYILDCIKKNISGKSLFGLLNRLLDMLGFQIINVKELREHNADKPDIRLKKPEDETVSGNFLTLDEEAYKTAAAKMLDVIDSSAKKNKAKYSEMERLFGQAREQLNSRTEELRQLRTDTDYMKKGAAERIQYILSLIGKNAEKTPVTEQTAELLGDMGLSAVWADDENAADGMFMTVKCSDPLQHNEKPCIISGNAVLLKGLKFVSDELPADPGLPSDGIY